MISTSLIFSHFRHYFHSEHVQVIHVSASKLWKGARHYEKWDRALGPSGGGSAFLYGGARVRYGKIGRDTEHPSTSTSARDRQGAIRERPGIASCATVPQPALRLYGHFRQKVQPFAAKIEAPIGEMVA